MTFYVHYMPWSGSRAKIVARLFGTKNITRQFVIQRSDEYIFKRDQKLTFVFSAQLSLGRIKRIEIDLQDTGTTTNTPPPKVIQYLSSMFEAGYNQRYS